LIRRKTRQRKAIRKSRDALSSSYKRLKDGFAQQSVLLKGESIRTVNVISPVVDYALLSFTM
jgi:hypothetical protein